MPPYVTTWKSSQQPAGVLCIFTYASLTSQAHWNAQQHSNEFVMDLLVSLDKLSMLVQELLVIEVGAAAQPMLAAQQRTAASTSVSTLLQTISAC
jgi:hypothetical protein